MLCEVVVGEAEQLGFLMAPGLTLALLLEQILVYVNLVFNDSEETVLIDKAPHVRQLLLDLKVALFEELGLEVAEDG